jgi:hypothetical protein
MDSCRSPKEALGYISYSITAFAMVSTLGRFLFAVCLVLVGFKSFGQGPCAVRVDTAAIVSGKNLDEFVTLLQAGPFQTFRTKNQIPRFISEQLKCLTTDNFSLANPGEAYDCCCTTSGELPRRQLMFLARNQNAVVLVYHIGQGKVAPTYVTIFRLKMGSAVDVWTGYGDWKATSIPDVIAHIQNQRTKGFMLLKDRIDF